MKKVFEDKEFYKKLFIIAIPVIIQQLLLTTFGIVDTFMVRKIYRGIAGVGLANQLSTIAGTIIFGLNVGVGLFIAQFFGERDEENMKKSFALMITLCFIIALAFTFIGVFFSNQILSIFTDDPEVLLPAKQYLVIVAYSYIPNLLSFCFSIAYRNIQKTFVPLMVSIVSSLVNLVFNYFLIFGIWVFPELGIQGAAIATVLASFVALISHYLYAKLTKQIFFPKLIHFKESLNYQFYSKILNKTYPLIINETFFSIGSALYVVIFNGLGSDAYEGYRIADSVVSIMFVVGMALGTAVSSMIGEKLGSKKIEEAKVYGKRFIFIGIIFAILLGGLTTVLAKPLVSLFRSDENITSANIAVRLMYVFGLRVALRVFIVILFSVFRAGGLSRFVMILDAGVMWLIGLPIAFIGYRYLKIHDIAILFLIIQVEPLVRIIIGFREYFKYRWARNVIQDI